MGRLNRPQVATNLERVLISLDMTRHGTDDLDFKRINRIVRERTRGEWPESRLRGILNGDSELKAEDLRRICEALQVGPERILWEVPPRKTRRRPESIWEEEDMSSR